MAVFLAPGSTGDGFAAVLLASLAGIGGWIAVTPGPSVCTFGSALRAITPLAGLACRVPFGIGAILAMLMAGYAAYRLWRAY